MKKFNKKAKNIILITVISFVILIAFLLLKTDMYDEIYYRPSAFSAVTDTFEGDYYLMEEKEVSLIHINKDGTVTRKIDYLNKVIGEDKKTPTFDYQLAKAHDDYYLVASNYINSKQYDETDIYYKVENYSAGDDDGLYIYSREYNYRWNRIEFKLDNSLYDAGFYKKGTPEYSYNYSWGANSSKKSSKYSYNSKDEFGDTVQNYMDDYFAKHPDKDPGYDW